jgi:hypothetical protein
MRKPKGDHAWSAAHIEQATPSVEMQGICHGIRETFGIRRSALQIEPGCPCKEGLVPLPLLPTTFVTGHLNPAYEGCPNRAGIVERSAARK